ncbi:MAG: UDP-N-acetylglucosamine 2-epimerase (non-hydrolyzing) [Phycisphaerales bacterium]|nr:MAG: UDP-N-acetylglucosamine 2-epimerase (non-hydrolyzing) [Phycisphaerales bacterium]
MKIVNVVGARPNFMKIAPLYGSYKLHDDIEPVLVHTGQHYDEKMSELFFRQLEIPEPDVNLEVGSASHAVQTAEIMKRFEPVLIEHRPDAVLVVGDVNSTISCGLVAVKLGIKLVHIEAGLRSYDRSMPEEINRVLTDSISDLLFCTEQSGVDNLIREGISKDKVFLVGNVMIDALVRNREKAEKSTVLDKLGLDPQGYAALTLHRPSNVDDAAVLSNIIDAIEVIQKHMPVVFPIHPRTRKHLDSTPLGQRIEGMKRILLTEPLSYLDFSKLMSSAKLVLTDSGGIQEETTFLRIPCLTLRENTERPVTVELGTNQVVGVTTERILEAFEDVMNAGNVECETPPLWDGHASERIAKILLDKI